MEISNVVCPWQEVCCLFVQGNDSAQFLQGYVTCDTRRLADAGSHGDSGAVPMALCSVKGRVIASGWLVNTPHGLGLILHRSLEQRVRAFLKPYLAFSKCQMAAGAGNIDLCDDEMDTATLVPGLRVRVYAPDAGNSDAQDCSARAAAMLVEHGFALVSEPISEQFLPQMLGLDAVGAVDFDKGCYLGQEIVARAQFRGAVKRRLVDFTWRDKPPVIGEPWPAESEQTPDQPRIDVVIAVAAGKGLGVAAQKSAQ